MDVDQPAITAPPTALPTAPTAHAHESGSGKDSSPGTTGSNKGPASTATAATGDIISGNKETAQYQSPGDAGSGPGSGTSSGLTVNQERGETYNNPEWKAKLEKLIQQKKFKIPDPPKTSSSIIY